VSRGLGKVGENMRDIGSYLEGKGNFSSDMGEEIREKKGGGSIGGRFDSDCITSLSKLLINGHNFSPRLFRRFRMRLASARDFRWRGTCGSTKSWAYYDRSSYFIIGNLINL